MLGIGGNPECLANVQVHFVAIVSAGGDLDLLRPADVQLNRDDLCSQAGHNLLGGLVAVGQGQATGPLQGFLVVNDGAFVIQFLDLVLARGPHLHVVRVISGVNLAQQGVFPEAVQRVKGGGIHLHAADGLPAASTCDLKRQIFCPLVSPAVTE